jgi:hypothetical protein
MIVMENVKESNKLIAEFMGGKLEMVDHTEGNEKWLREQGKSEWFIETWTTMPSDISKPTEPYRLGAFKYHSSWDWLMPVVNKASYESERIRGNFEIEMWAILTNSIHTVYQNVIQFIQWYNEQNQTA